MITLLTGENSFEVGRALADISSSFDGATEKIEGSDLLLSQLPDVLMGVSLFSEKRLVIIKSLGENRAVWPVFGDWLSKVSDDIHLVLVESKPDKRTSTYKALKGSAEVIEFQAWTDRDVAKADKWAVSEAKKQGFELNNKCVHTLVQWVGADQWQLFHAIQKLALTDAVTVESIKDIIEPNPVENVFNLFETALRGDMQTLSQIIKTLEQTEDVYRLISLLMSQAFQLAVVVSADKSDNAAKDFAIHPYVVSKLTPVANRIGKGGITKIISIFTELDDDVKLSRAEPWLLVERSLMKVANI